MISRLSPARRGLIVTALGSSLTVSWASSYYIPAVLAMPMAEELGLSLGAVYIARSRVIARLREKVAQLEADWEENDYLPDKETLLKEC